MITPANNLRFYLAIWGTVENNQAGAVLPQAGLNRGEKRRVTSVGYVLKSIA